MSKLSVRSTSVRLSLPVLSTIPPAELGDHSYFAYVLADPIAPLYTELTARGVQLIKTLRNEPWGMREFGIRTVDGHCMARSSVVDSSPCVSWHRVRFACPVGLGRPRARLDAWRLGCWRANAGSSRLLQKQRGHPRVRAVQPLRSQGGGCAVTRPGLGMMRIRI